MKLSGSVLNRLWAVILKNQLKTDIIKGGRSWETTVKGSRRTCEDVETTVYQYMKTTGEDRFILTDCFVTQCQDYLRCFSPAAGKAVGQRPRK